MQLEMNWPRLNPQQTQARFKQQLDDFQVREVLDVEDEGEGEHQWLWVNKEGANTRFVAEKLAKFAGVHPRQVSYSGMKDRHAQTQQWFSVQLPGQQLLDWSAMQLPGVTIEQVIRRTKKLKLGYHKANQFRIRLRDVADPQCLTDNWQRLCQQGTLNYFGSQRFGHQGGNVEQGLQWLQQTPPAKVSKAKRSLWLSALRSYLFNQTVAARWRQHQLQPLAGDCVMLHGSQSVFIADQWDPELQQRLAEGDIQLTAPMPGEDGPGKVSAEALTFEQQTLAPYQDWFELFAKVRLKASRRPYRLQLSDPSLQWQDNDAIVSFTLPTGSFATTCINELIDLAVNENDENSVE